MKQIGKITGICIILLVLLITLSGCDLYLNWLAQFGINADVQARLKVTGRVWGLASSGGNLYAVAVEETGPVVYEIDEETFDLTTTYILSGGGIENKFDEYTDDGTNNYEATNWQFGGRFQGFTDSNDIFYIMDTIFGGRVWLNSSDNTAVYLPDYDSEGFYFYFNVGSADYVLSYAGFTDIEVYNIQNLTTPLTTLNFDGEHHLKGAVHDPDLDEVKLLFVPCTTDSSTDSTITCQSVSLDASSVGVWSADYPFGGTEISLSFGEKTYSWTGNRDSYYFPEFYSFFANDELIQVSLKESRNAGLTPLRLFQLDGTLMDILKMHENYRPVLGSSGMVLYGANENFILKYGVD